MTPVRSISKPESRSPMNSAASRVEASASSRDVKQLMVVSVPSPPSTAW